MTTEALITDLIRRWEELRLAGKPAAIEDICREHPDLADDLRERVRLLESMDRRLPPAQSPTAALPAAVTVQRGAAHVSLLKPGHEPIPGYRLIEGLGRGGFGEVWKAAAPGGFLVALKFVLLGGRAGPAESRALELIRHIRHPNLLGTHLALELDGILVIGMELADGTLGDRLAASIRAGKKGVPREELMEYMAEAAKGLDFLNSPTHCVDGRDGVSVQHRDIKPQNILIVGGGVKVADFGLARLLEQTVVSHSGSLTPLYAAPEFFNGQTTRNSDQYSLAVTYCQLRAGRLPFEGNMAQVTAGHLYRPPELRMLPEAERPVVGKALAKEPDQRWANCQTFVDALAALYHVSTRFDTTLRPAAEPAPTVGELRRYAGSTEKVLSLAYSPDGRHVLTGARTGAAILWEAASGKELRRFDGHEGVVRSVAFSPDARVALTAGDDGTVRLWDARGGGELKRLSGELPKVKCAAFSPVGHVLFGGVGGQIRLWNPGSGELTVLRGHAGRVCTLAVSPDGRFAVSGGGDEQTSGRWVGRDAFALRLWELDPGRLVRSFDGHADQVYHAVFSYDSKQILSGSADGTIRLWDVESGLEKLCFRGHHGAVNKIDLSADGRSALSAGADRTVRLWRLPIGQRHRFTGHADRVNAVAFSPDGKHALSAGSDGTIRVWGLPA